MARNSPPPSTQVPLTNNNLITPAWQRFMTDRVALPIDVAVQTLTGSPFSFVAYTPGTVFVVGGTVSAIAILRGTATVATGMTSGMFTLGQGDTLRITYTVAPTVTFLPT